METKQSFHRQEWLTRNLLRNTFLLSQQNEKCILWQNISLSCLCRIVTKVTTVQFSSGCIGYLQTLVNLNDLWPKAHPSFFKHKYTFSPAELSSERGEKEVLADSIQLGSAAAAINAVARELLRSACLPGREKMAPEGTSSMTGRALLQSMLVSADDSCHCPHRPTPLMLCPPPHGLPVCLSLSFSRSLSLRRFYAFKNVSVFNVHNMLPILGEQ